MNMLKAAFDCTVGRLVLRPEKGDAFWEPRFDELARYNADVSHGLMHTSEHVARMKAMQADYNQKIKTQNDQVEFQEGSGAE